MVFRLVVTAVLLMLLSACQAWQFTPSNLHKKSVQQWHSLAQFSGDTLKETGYTVAGSLQFVTNELGEETVKIVNVRLTKKVKSTEIDLLAPSFINKFVCKKQCYPINSMHQVGNKLVSLLTYSFSTSEADLFEFYGFMYKANQLVNAYYQQVPQQAKEYFSWVYKQRHVSGDVGEFIKYFDKTIEKQSVINYVSNGNSALSFELLEELNDLPNSTSEISPNNLRAEASSELPEAGKDLSNEHWLSSQEARGTGDEVLISDLLLEEKSKLEYGVSRLQNFTMLKSASVRVGDVVCSFSDSSIAVVKELESETSVLVDMLATSVRIKDGLRLTTEPGYLFEEQEKLLLVKKKGERLYYKSDITRCEFDGIEALVSANKN